MSKRAIGFMLALGVVLLGVLPVPAYAWWHGPHVWVGGPFWYPYYAPPVGRAAIAARGRSAIAAADLRAAASTGARRLVLVLLRELEGILPVRQGVPRRVDASPATSSVVEPTDDRRH